MAKKKLEYLRLKEELQIQGKTQQWLADQLGVPFLTVTRYANNNHEPSFEVLFKIAKILNVKPGELLNNDIASEAPKKKK